MHGLADREGVDLLLIDTGDRVEGNGLYDASDPKGKYTFDIFKHQDVDVICSGNHELYKEKSSFNEYTRTVPNFKNAYLASNIDIRTSPSGPFKPLAQRYRKFTTKNLGIRIVAFGFLYNFQGNAQNTRVQLVEDTIKEQWFQSAIHDENVDLFVVAGHVAADSDEYLAIWHAIRDAQWDVPIQFFAGHSHIRDFRKYDDLAAAIESGRYMETIGFASIENLNIGRKKGVRGPRPKFRRKYIDNNLFSLHHHSLRDEKSFTIELGANVSSQIAKARNDLHLDDCYGCAPTDYWLDRAPMNSENSIFSWLGTSVIPEQLKAGDGVPKLVFTNTGAMRFDIFRGPFTEDSKFLVSPFTSGLRQIKNVNYQVGTKLLKVLNDNGQIFKSLDLSLDTCILPPSLPLEPSKAQPRPSPVLAQYPLNKPQSLTPGYTTIDDDGFDGDDTAHSPIQYFPVPNCIQSEVDFPGRDDGNISHVDIVYNEFIEPWIIKGLTHLGEGRKRNDSSPYVDGRTFTDIIADWVKENWPCE